MEPPRFNDLKVAILYELFLVVAEDDNKGLDSVGLSSRFPNQNVTAKYIDRALHILLQEGYIEQIDDDENLDAYYSISLQGIQEVDDHRDEENSDIWNYQRIRVDWLFRESGNDDVSNSAEIPASDRIVTLDDNSPAYNETVNALRQLSDEASKSNELTDLFADPEDRIVITSQIDVGIALIESKRVIPSTVIRALLYPINFIKEKMPDAALGILANKAWDLIVKLFENST